MSKWIKQKNCGIYIHEMEYHPTFKEKEAEILLFVTTQMNLETII